MRRYRARRTRGRRSFARRPIRRRGRVGRRRGFSSRRAAVRPIRIGYRM